MLEVSLGTWTGGGPSGVIYGETFRGGDDGAMHKYTRALMGRTLPFSMYTKGQRIRDKTRSATQARHAASPAGADLLEIV